MNNFNIIISECTNNEYTEIKLKHKTDYDLMIDTKLKKVLINNELVALIEWYPDFEGFIWYFEVIPQKRAQGWGKIIISELQKYNDILQATPSSQETEFFWAKCGFVMDDHPNMIWLKRR